MKVLVLNYTHPEGYPPTFNAINNLSKNVDEVFVLSTRTLETKWNYSDNVHLNLLDSNTDRFKAVTISKGKKIKTYFNYIKAIYNYIRKDKVDLIIIYDNVPFFFYTIIAKVLPKGKLPVVWYHNHDVFPLSNYKKYSVNWFGAICEQKYLNQASYFSLPANERKEYFKLNEFKGKYFFIPNYPSSYFHGKLKIDTRKSLDRISFVYPGNICFKHGFEDLIPILGEKVDEKELHLTLLGDVKPKYKEELIALANKHNVSNHVHFIGRNSYFDVPKVMTEHHIGWAVNKPLDVTYSTGGTAANKIYEYLALSMPIVIFDNEHYREYLDNNDWAFFSDLSKDSLLEQIKDIVKDYNNLSQQARESFENNFTFEEAFNKALQTVLKEIS